MAVVIVRKKITEGDLKQAQEEYDTYVKVVVDIEQGILGAGGEWHYDAEQVMLGEGSRQENLWGGGINLKTGVVDYVSLINTRPNFNRSQIVEDDNIKRMMLEIIKNIFTEYVLEG